jgi:hypothetical protein
LADLAKKFGQELTTLASRTQSYTSSHVNKNTHRGPTPGNVVYVKFVTLKKLSLVRSENVLVITVLSLAKLKSLYAFIILQSYLRFLLFHGTSAHPTSSARIKTTFGCFCAALQVILKM